MSRRYQAHPIAKDEAYELRPPLTARQDGLIGLLCIIGMIACYLVASLH